MLAEILQRKYLLSSGAGGDLRVVIWLNSADSECREALNETSSRAKACLSSFLIMKVARSMRLHYKASHRLQVASSIKKFASKLMLRFIQMSPHFATAYKSHSPWRKSLLQNNNLCFSISTSRLSPLRMRTAAWNWKLKLEHQGKKNEKFHMRTADLCQQTNVFNSDPQDLTVTWAWRKKIFSEMFLLEVVVLWRKVMRKKWNFLSAETWNDLIMISDAMMTLSGINISNDGNSTRTSKLFCFSNGRNEKKWKRRWLIDQSRYLIMIRILRYEKERKNLRWKQEKRGWRCFQIIHHVVDVYAMRISSDGTEEAVTIND